MSIDDAFGKQISKGDEIIFIDHGRLRKGQVIDFKLNKENRMSPDKIPITGQIVIRYNDVIYECYILNSEGHFCNEVAKF